LCTKAVYLDQGKVVSVGDIDTVTREYMNARSTIDASHKIDSSNKKYRVQILSVLYLNKKRQPDQSFASNEPISILVESVVNERIPNVFLTLKVFNSELDVVFETNDFENNEEVLVNRDPGHYVNELVIPASLLAPGQYFLGIAVNKRKNVNGINVIQKIDHVAPFEVFDNGSVMSRNGIPYHGLVHPDIVWQQMPNEDYKKLSVGYSGH